jgi:hypothetical protein
LVEVGLPAVHVVVAVGDIAFEGFIGRVFEE